MAEEDLHHEYEIAVELYKDGEYADALSVLNRIAQERPDSRHVMYTRGLCLVALGRIGEARAVRDQLSGNKGSAAQQFTAKLDAKLREKLDEIEKTAHKGQGRPHSSLSGISEPRSSRSTAAAIVIFLIIVAVIAGAVLLYVQQDRARSAASDAAGDDSATPFEGTGPDQYVEAALFLPTGTETSYRFAVFFSPPEGEVSNTTTDAKEDCAAGPVLADWNTMKAKAKKALSMSNSSEELLKGSPRNKLVATLVLPRAGAALSGKLSDKQIETFSPGGVKDLASVAQACGKPERTEAWTRLGSCVGLTGQVQWWGRLGLAADAGGQISHVLLRAYPGDKR